MAFRILVVDDEPDVELLIRQRFRRKTREGEFEFEFARNGEHALEKLSQDPSIDIVMSDINMPVMDGLTLLTRLSGMDRVLRTVMVSAYGDMQNIRIAMNRGAYDFLTKPIDFADFEATLLKTIQEVKGMREGHEVRRQLTAIENELVVASRIQQALLPGRTQAFPGRDEFEIYAEMTPARSVGGDFFDYFLIDQDHLGFLVGDVSGKGVPAAIFMAVSRTLLRATAVTNVSSAECIQDVNRILARQSDSAMFVTIFYGILDTRTGEMDYCNAGHNPPLLFSREGAPRTPNDGGGLLAGMFEQSEYTGGKLRMEPGDIMLVFTDGVTEATDAEESMFGDERLLKAVEAAGPDPAADQLIRRIFGEVRDFAGATTQSDDITALALKFVGRRTAE